MRKLDKSNTPSVMQWAVGLLAVILFAGCEEVIDLELNDPEHQRVVVEGRLTTTYGPQHIRLTQTLSYFDHEQAPALTGIEASIVEEGSGLEFPLELDNADLGVYRTPPMAGKVGESYTLKITQGDQLYEASALLDTVPDIDSLNVEHIKFQRFGRVFDYYSIQASFMEPAMEGNMYCAYLYLNDTLYTDQAGEAAYFGDRALNGYYWSNVEIFSIPEQNITLKRNKVRIEFFSISMEEFDFLTGLFSESYGNGSIYSGPPANIPTNIYNQTDGIDGVGFFSASDRYVIETTFNKSEGGISPGL
ncbi:MAG: DUF4249 domain-containing protein [Bacteroidales bacterium]|nr:DUF4249 domain-containing protein [Bacteroidales bacterium]